MYACMYIDRMYDIHSKHQCFSVSGQVGYSILASGLGNIIPRHTIPSAGSDLALSLHLGTSYLPRTLGTPSGISVPETAIAYGKGPDD